MATIRRSHQRLKSRWLSMPSHLSSHCSNGYGLGSSALSAPWEFAQRQQLHCTLGYSCWPFFWSSVPLLSTSVSKSKRRSQTHILSFPCSLCSCNLLLDCILVLWHGKSSKTLGKTFPADSLLRIPSPLDRLHHRASFHGRFDVKVTSESTSWMKNLVELWLDCTFVSVTQITV